MTLFVGVWSYSLDEYAKGVLRAAAEEGAQAGATAGGSTFSCQEQAEVVLHTLIRGSLADGLRVTCTADGAEMVALGTGSVPTLAPGLGRVSLSVVGVALIEPGAG